MKACNQCGKCCQKYADGGLSASSDEIDWWEAHRPDIARFVRDGLIWMDPDSGRQLSTCPWLQQLPDENKYTCAIYHDRPEDCRHYPLLVTDMINDECEMLEPVDLQDLAKAQAKLVQP